MSANITSLLDILEKHFDDADTWSLLESIWQHERWFDAPRQAKAIRTAQEALLSAGVADATVDDMPADGRTRFQDWMAPLAWDCDDARVAIAGTGEVLGDRRQNPCTTVMCSAPLPPTTAQVVDGDTLSSLDPASVNGKWILTAKMPQEMKHKILGLRPVGIISDYLAKGVGFNDNAVKWHNGWSDGPDGWYFHADDQPMTGFSISPAAGRILRGRMAAGRTEVHGYCNSRLYEGTFQNLTATIPGRDPGQEVWIMAHSAEQGAHDNCSGQAVITSALILLRRMIDKGILPPPQRTIRLVMMPECLGITSFVTAHDDLRRKAVMSFYFDGVGDRRGGDRRFSLFFGPMSNPSFGWSLAGILADQLEKRHKDFGADPRWQVNSADDMIADPLCGIPSQWLGATGATSMGYHSSADTPAVCSDVSLRCGGIMAAAWAYTAATLNDSSVTAVLPDACAWIDRHVIGGEGDARSLRNWAAGGMLRGLARLGISADVTERAASCYAPTGAPPLADLPSDGPCYQRKLWGTTTMESLPRERRKWSRWSAATLSALYWTDGQRPISAAARLAAVETGRKPPTEEYFQALVEAGIAEKV